MGEWTFPVWATTQVCLVVYLVGVGLPYVFQYVSPKEYKRLNRAAIERYETQKQEIIRRCRQQEKAKTQRALLAAERNNRPAPKTNLRQNVRINFASRACSSSSSSSSLSSDTSIEETTEEEEEEEETVVKNDRAMLMQYVHGMDLFDGQSSTTSASAATTIIIGTPKKVATRKPGSVRYL